MKIKTKVSSLKEFLELASVKGRALESSRQEHLINNLLIKVGADGSASVAAMDKECAILVRMKYTGFSESEEGEFPIGDVEAFLSFLDRFAATDEVILSIDGNEVCIKREKPRKTAFVPLTGADMIDSAKPVSAMSERLTVKDIPTFKGTDDKEIALSTQIKCDVKNLQDVIGDGASINQFSFPFKVSEDGKFIAGVGEKGAGRFVSEIASEIEGGNDIESNYSYGVDAIFSVLKGKIVLNLGNGSPLLIRQKDAKHQIMYFVSPA